MASTDHEATKGLTKPPALRRGDRVAVISPSWSAAGQYPERLAAGVEGVQAALGVEVIVMPHATEVTDWVAGSPKHRAADINAAFADPRIKAVLCAVAGQHVAHVLEYLDFDLIAANPKVFVGSSDASVLHHALAARSGIVTFTGPMVLTQWADWSGPHPLTTDWFRQVTMSTTPLGPVAGAQSYSDERVSWTKRRSWQRKYHPAPAYAALRNGAVEGPALVCSLSSATAMLASAIAPRFSGAVLFVETPGSGYNPQDADRDLAYLRLNGVFDEIKALVVGRPYHFDADARAQLHELILVATADHSFPILVNVDIGHTDPQLTIAQGCRVGVHDATLSLLESGVV